MVASRIKKLFTKKWFVLLFTFTVELIFNYLFEVQHIGGYYIYADIALGPIFGLMFGPIGALGFALGTLAGELLEGIGLPAPLIDFVITFFISVLTYRLWYTTFNKGKKDTPRFNSTYNIIKFLSITILISIVYFSFLVISFSLFHNLNYSYSISDVDFNVPYMLNIITFTIIFGLLLISSFNILKIPLKTPKKRISKININQNYLLIILLICVGYFLFKEFIMNITSIRHFFMLVTIITSILLYFNTFDVKVEPTKDNYSIIEEMILIFLAIITLTIVLNFNYFSTLILSYVPEIDPSYQILIILSFTSVFILLVSLIYIRFVERTITNPLYDMINTADNYFKTKNKIESVHKLKKYITNDDSIGLLANSFVTLYDKIRTNLNQLQITTSEKEKFETEFDVASRIQSNMLPKNFDELAKNESFEIYANMKPAREVGGDFYDYFKIDEDNVYFVIGDVSGKGIPSTLFMVKTMYLIENHAKFNEDLSQAIEKVNNLAYERNDEELFVTIWLGKLNLKTGKLSYVNAGHNQPLIKHDSNNFEYLKTHPNLVIGGMEGIQYNEHEINLNAGDMIFLYTDGVTEANDNYKEFYGKNRLKETINENKNKKLNDIINEITKDIDKFCNNSEQYDDITMLIIKYNGWVENEC
ncbi:SpoIIE family protein phosphatase [Methanobrevibacter sp.]|uniref:SpoIIE family protein phosphatase n=1 Tax=Methanobrevibacter sp. TaxID=66852 RepID=UPI002600565A|nr:SpoIIE family protein phosphatase [Methanobrevibacter sp.]MBQ2832433.1 SpoIIE family protein phosphatase [Methanobrevibacter sp.]